jgi:hypothetical protein
MHCGTVINDAYYKVDRASAKKVGKNSQIWVSKYVQGAKSIALAFVKKKGGMMLEYK